MPPSKYPSTLKNEVLKLAKLSNIQGGLPPLMRGLPVLAILAGEIISKATNGSNIVEQTMLGPDETMLLGSPIAQVSMSTARKEREWIREGMKMMCMRCGKGGIESVASSENRSVQAVELSSIYLGREKPTGLQRCYYPGMVEWDRHPLGP